MQHKFTIALATLLAFNGLSLKAQTISTFDDLTLPGADTNFASTLPAETVYHFESGNIKCYGSSNAWGSYADFNYSNMTDVTTPDYTNDKAAITGKGVDQSDNYAICYVTTDFENPIHPDQTIPSGVTLTGNARGGKVAGAYITNATYAYYYMADSAFQDKEHWFMLTVRGYLNGQKTTDSVNFMLGDFKDGKAINVKEWTWIDLTPLGDVDSLTFDLSSSDKESFGINVPTYFAMDNLITLDGECPDITEIFAQNVSEDSADVSWSSLWGKGPYEIAIDESVTLEPSSSPISVEGQSYTAKDLKPNTEYVFHIRTVCDDDTYSDWDTLSFKTLNASSIANIPNNRLPIYIYPNPATDYLHIQAEKPVDVLIYNAIGQEVLIQKQAKKVDVSSLASGIYLLRAEDGNQSGQLIRFVKQ